MAVAKMNKNESIFILLGFLVLCYVLKECQSLHNKLNIYYCIYVCSFCSNYFDMENNFPMTTKTTIQGSKTAIFFTIYSFTPQHERYF